MRKPDVAEWEPGERIEQEHGIPEDAGRDKALALAVIMQSFADISAYITVIKHGGGGSQGRPLAYYATQAEDAYLFLLGLNGGPQWVRAYCHMADINWQCVLNATMQATSAGLLFRDPQEAFKCRLPLHIMRTPGGIGSHPHKNAMLFDDDAA